MDWTLAKNQGPGIAHTVCRALEDSYFATSSTLAGLAFTCRPTKSVYLHNSFIASYYFTICSCKVARCNICKPFARIVRRNCLRLTRWCRISGSPPWNKRHLIGLISDATHVIYFKWDDTSTLSDLCTHLLIPFAQTGKSKPAGRHMASLKKENS